MAPNVARALGYTEGRASVAQAVRCPACGEFVAFGTDDLGRTVERCRCGPKLVAVAPDVAREVEAGVKIEATREAKRVARKQQKPGFGEWLCENAECGKSFTRNVKDQRFCSVACGSSGSAERRKANQTTLPNRTLGISGTGRRRDS